MRLVLQYGLVVAMFLFGAVRLSATHMVGGEITYRCLGNDEYEITLRVFRDCDTGVPWFDDPASIGIFDSGNNLIQDVRVNLTALNDTLDSKLDDPCLVVPPNVCIHTTTYTARVTLPYLVGGYQLVYQRCCRNQDILNIVDPLSTGATYSALISEEALLSCNNSAVFKSWPPVYICKDYPISFDHSATDAEGDSIVYSLCAPYTGATPFNSMPQPPYAPPYNPVVWASGYSASNMMGGADPLAIDSRTGLLTGTPRTPGVFVVGVCAEEYRNGVLISTTKRDFQYAVGICGSRVSSAFFAPEVQCDNSLTVSFLNTSSSLTGSYLWDFGDTGTLSDTSTVQSPTYIYGDTGVYEVTLIADVGARCADTMRRRVSVQYESLSVDFETEIESCGDSLVLGITDLSVDSISTISSWSWSFGNGDTASVPYPTAYYTQTGTYTVVLEVVSANGCRGYHYETLVLDVPDITSADTVSRCGSAPIRLNPGGNPRHHYRWSPGVGLSDSTVASPFASPSKHTTYTVHVWTENNGDTCRLEQTVTVLVSPGLDIQTVDTIRSCDSIFEVSGQVLLGEAAEWLWSNNITLSPVVSRQQQFSWPLSVGRMQRLFVEAVDSFGCKDQAFVDLVRENIDLQADFSYEVVGCGPNVQVEFTDLSVDTSEGAVIGWLWDFGNGQTSTQQNPTIVYDEAGTYSVTLTITSSGGCTGVQTKSVQIIPLSLTSSDTVGICQGTNSVVLNPGGNPNFTYQWSPATGLSSTTVASPIASPLVPTTYTVTVRGFNGIDTCTQVNQVHVFFSGAIDVTTSSREIYCGSEVVLEAESTEAIAFEWSGDPSFFTILSTNNPTTIHPTTFPLAGYYVRATDRYGCRDTAFILVEQRTQPIQVDFNYTSLGCGENITLQFEDKTSDTTQASITKWRWVTSNGLIDSIPNPRFTFTTSGVHTVRLEVELANGCTGQVTKSLDFNLAQISSRDTMGICVGEVGVFLNPNASSRLDYQWSPSTGLSDPQIGNPYASPSSPTTYTVSVTGYGTTDTCLAVYDVHVMPSPEVVVSLPSDSLFCTTQLNLRADVASGATLEWATNRQFTPLVAGNVNPLILNITTGGYRAKYYVRATNAYGCTAIDSSDIQRTTAAVPTSFDIIGRGCTDTLHVQFENTSPPFGSPVANWTWSLGNGNIVYAPNAQAQYTQNGMYPILVNVSYTNGCFGFHRDTVRVDFARFEGPNKVGICAGDSVQLNIGGNPNLRYKWSPSYGLSNPNIASPKAFPGRSTHYTVEITANNSFDTCTIVDTVWVGISNPQLSVMDDTVLCRGQVELEAFMPAGASYLWALDPYFNQSMGVGNPFNVNINRPQRFYVKATDSLGCEAIDSVFIDYSSGVEVDFTATKLRCGDSLQIIFQDVTSDTVGNPIRSWSWDFGNGEASMQPVDTVGYGEGRYTVRLTVEAENGCTGIDVMPLELSLPQLPQTDTVVLCADMDSIALDIGVDPTWTYTWQAKGGIQDVHAAQPKVKPSQSTRYDVSINVPFVLNGVLDSCVFERSIYVDVASPIEVVLEGDSIWCGHLSILSASSLQGRVFDWSFKNTFSPVEGVGQSFSYKENKAQVIYVRATDSLGCTAIDSLALIDRSIQASIDSASVFCAGDAVTLQVQSTGDISYTWSPNETILQGQGTPQIVVTPSTTTLYQVILTELGGCTDTLFAPVNVWYSAPVVDITASPDSFLLGETVQLSTPYAPNYQYQWLANSTLSNTTYHNPVATPLNDEYYEVTVTNSVGCSQTDSIWVRRRQYACTEPYIFIPNAFTPDGDGLNDILYVRSSVATELSWVIYDRWGEEVFRTSHLDAGWDGSFKGKTLPPDVYAYYLEVHCLGGAVFKKKGNVTLIR